MMVLLFNQLSYNMDISSKYWENSSSVMSKTLVFGIFRLHIATVESCRICSFVEQVKLYRLVYDSIRIVRKLVEKIFKYKYGIIHIFTKNR